MLVDIQIDEKSLNALVKFELVNFKDQKSYKDALATIMMIAGDFSLDPELELEDLQDIVSKGNEEDAKSLLFVVNEDEIEAEFSK